MSNLVAYPALLCFGTGIVQLLLHGRVALQRAVALLSSIAGIVLSVLLTYTIWTSGIQVQTAGGWPVPFGITLTADLFSGMMMILAAVVLFTSILYIFRDMNPDSERTFFYPVLFFMMAGVNLSFATGDIFNLYVAFEVMLISSYFLMALGSTGPQVREGLKYLLLNTVASSLFLFGVALLYGVTSSLNMADIAAKAASEPGNPYITLSGMLFLVVFAAKGALFPFYWWLPRSYYYVPNGIAPLFASMLTKVGVYGLIRVFTLIFIHDSGLTHSLLLVIGGLTMFLGVMGAISQYDFKAILSYHIISQIGYMIMGLGLYTVLGLAGAVFYIAHHIIVKSGLFLLSGATSRITGQTDFKHYSGLLASYPGLAYTFFATAISLAGVPPFSGFFAKFALLRAAVEKGAWGIAAVSLLVSFFTLFSMIKIFRKAYWGRPSGQRIQRTRRDYFAALTPAVILLALSVAMGLGGGYMMEFALATADQLMHPNIYVEAVLGR
ncbi:proton-conducting transporter transmembrane domain-containing protein [Symbiobacterium thermophilum]|uniref:proton-conducting transporter transmembrane domain-containing protein n=1 Tax=Symbiobacterium thermophilum TaxID=2734 RepID=UPI0035C7685D